MCLSSPPISPPPSSPPISPPPSFSSFSPLTHSHHRSRDAGSKLVRRSGSHQCHAPRWPHLSRLYRPSKTVVGCAELGVVVALVELDTKVPTALCWAGRWSAPTQEQDGDAPSPCCTRCHLPHLACCASMAEMRRAG
jgi:hypothetical protein